jgi:hypothetical protein
VAFLFSKWGEHDRAQNIYSVLVDWASDSIDLEIVRDAVGKVTRVKMGER